ncbi:SDR family NAD(P)-dependent oxidoreductase [Streptomyces sp. DSM 41987]|uniref:SDR family NAD(P)-dependent oxidoreductase n=1 Tax=Streptomyces TaxID=1883 RepID=UPI0018DFB4C9|nr:SDR family oxidoreductase [Streptomyces fildesensis]
MPAFPAPAVALVTGGASGIGLALCDALTHRGITVVSADLHPGPDGPRRESLVLDVTDPDAVTRTYQGVFERHGRLDMVCNNAGIVTCGATETLSLAHWQRAMDVNFFGVVHGVRACYTLMIEQGHGQIINTASIAGRVAIGGLSPYIASKHAVVGMSLGLRAEAARYNIRVNVVCPSLVDTPILDHLNPDLPATALAADAKTLIRTLHPWPYPPERLAQHILTRLTRNKAVIIAPARARAYDRLNRHAPRLADKLNHMLTARALSTAAHAALPADPKRAVTTATDPAHQAQMSCRRLG